MRLVMPGRVFRNEAISARAHCMFHQVEGLYIDEGVSFADLKQTILGFAEAFFGPGTRIRMRPSYFPFTEPSAEVDVYWGLETEVDERITKGTGWLEIHTENGTVKLAKGPLDKLRRFLGLFADEVA